MIFYRGFVSKATDQPETSWHNRLKVRALNLQPRTLQACFAKCRVDRSTLRTVQKPLPFCKRNPWEAFHRCCSYRADVPKWWGYFFRGHIVRTGTHFCGVCSVYIPDRE